MRGVVLGAEVVGGAGRHVLFQPLEKMWSLMCVMWWIATMGASFGCNFWTLSAQRIFDAGDVYVFVDMVHAISCFRHVNAWQKKMCTS